MNLVRADVSPGHSQVQIHPALDLYWRSYELFNGIMYIDPTHSGAEDVLLQARSAPTHILDRNLPELGSGLRGIVFQAGDLAIKRCVSGVRPEITGLGAIAANAALATALASNEYKIGDYRLKGCMPRGYFEPTSRVGQPTWIMDLVPGENAQDMFKPPAEATRQSKLARDSLCLLALQEYGIDPSTVYLDSTESANLIVDEANQNLTVIDAMAQLERNGTRD